MPTSSADFVGQLCALHDRDAELVRQRGEISAAVRALFTEAKAAGADPATIIDAARERRGFDTTVADDPFPSGGWPEPERIDFRAGATWAHPSDS